MKMCLVLSQCWILMQLCTVLYSYNTLCKFELLREDNDLNKSSIHISKQVVADIRDTQECWFNTTLMFSQSNSLDNDVNSQINTTDKDMNSQLNSTDNDTNSQINSTEKEAHLDTDEANEKLILIIRIACTTSTVVHLMDVSTHIVNLQLDMDFYLSISKCSIAMKEISVFQTIGKIIMLRNLVNPQVFEPEYNCSYAEELVTMKLHIELTYLSGIFLNSKIFFWETCEQIFPKLTLLSIDGCIEINITSIQEKFPNIHTLLLENRVVIKDHFQFPWKTEQPMTDISMNNIFEVFYILDAVHYGVSPVNSLSLRGMHMNLTLLHLDGVINELSLIAMDIYDLEPSFLQNVTITDKLDLSVNNLKTIDPKLFQNHHNLKRLHLQQNNLRVIQQDMFRSLKHLQYIDLSNNIIATIHTDPFTSLHNLKVILFAKNNITYIPPDMFKDQTESLEYLTMNLNPLTDIPVWPMYATNLVNLKLDSTNINGESIVRFLKHLSTLDEAASNTEAALISCGPHCRERIISLQQNNISTIPTNMMTLLLFNKLSFLMSTFTMDFRGNPITCNCDTVILRSLALGISYDHTASDHTLQNNLKTWICAKPTELKGRMMYNILNNEKYCPTNIDCPHGCNCYKRNAVDIIIVDCTNVPLMNMPRITSSYKLELWFENSSISEISPVPYLKNVTYLILSKNKLKQINVSVINKLESVEVIFLHSNHLTSIPIQIRSLNLSTLTLSDNRFVCDCTSRWLKTWLLGSEDIIRDWTHVQCLSNSNTIKQVIALPYSSFVCNTANSVSFAEHVFLPSVIIGCVLFVLMSLSLITYFYRFNVKVFLYIHFGIHPFDRAKEENNIYDAVVIYSPEDVDFRDRIVPYLTQKGYVTADINHDAFIGYSLLHNTERLIHCSTRVIICFSEFSKSNKIAEFAWNIAYEKATTLSLNSIILVTEKHIAQTQNLDDNLRQFIKGNQFINREAKLLEGKIAYLMPEIHIKKQNDIELEINGQGEQDVEAETRILLFYPDDLHLYVRNELTPFLTADNLDVKYLEMEFMPGGDIRDELPGILDASRHLLFILSQQMVDDDEVKMYVLTQALTKTQLENHNYLLLATSGHIDLEDMTNDLQKYVENYVTISINNPEFKERILQSIVQDTHRGRERVNNLENDPLLNERI